MKSKIFPILLLIFAIGFVSAYDVHQQNTTFYYSETVANADSCNLTTITYPNGSTSSLGLEMVKNGYEFSSNISNNNFSQLGDICWGIVCQDTDATPKFISSRKCLTITSSGESPTTTRAIGNLIVIIFLISLMIITYLLINKMNLEKWHNSIIKRYQNRNYIKLVLSSITYNILKNSIVIYYLLGLPIMLLVTDIVYIFQVTSMITLMKVFLGIYVAGVIILGAYIFSNVQEWLMDLLEEIKNMNWGIE
jgi:hypothetical protein